jgi:fermentation-respiration switch protein FrsA (DUF1100 family)
VPARLLGLAAAALLAALPFHAAVQAALSAAFLAEFLAEGAWRPLSAVVPAPRERPGAGPDEPDLYLAPRPGGGAALVLVHGLAPEGRHDARLRRAAALLARAGWTVAVPTVPGLTALRLRPEDARPVVRTVETLAAAGHGRIALLAVSVGAGPAFLAAADPAVAPRLSGVLALGGYADALGLLRHVLTGGHVDPAVVERVARANAELVDPAGRRLVDNRDPARFDALAAALPPGPRALLEALSPARQLRGPGPALFLVHGRADPAVPPSETVALAGAARRAGRAVRVAIVGGLDHVEGGRAAALADLARLWAVLHAFRATTGAA